MILAFSLRPEWCEHVGIGDLVVAVFEVTRLQPTLFHQPLEAVVGLAQTDSQLFSQFTLADIRVCFKELEKLKSGFFVHFFIITENSNPVAVIFDGLQAGYRHTMLFLHGGSEENSTLFLHV